MWIDETMKWLALDALLLEMEEPEEFSASLTQENILV